MRVAQTFYWRALARTSLWAPPRSTKLGLDRFASDTAGNMLALEYRLMRWLQRRETRRQIRDLHDPAKLAIRMKAMERAAAVLLRPS